MNILQTSPNEYDYWPVGIRRARRARQARQARQTEQTMGPIGEPVGCALSGCPVAVATMRFLARIF